MSRTPSKGKRAVPSKTPSPLERAQKALPDAACVSRASSLLKAVSDPTRLKILAGLATTELRVSELAILTKLSESAVSHQLRLLREERLVDFRKEGRMAFYRLQDHHVTDLIQSALEHAREGI